MYWLNQNLRLVLHACRDVQWYAQQKGQWTNVVDESKLEATIGNPMEQSIWTELGTGEYALNA